MPITLMPERVKKEKRKEVAFRYLFLGGVGILVLVAGAVVGISGFKFALQREVQGLKTKIEEETSFIKSRQQVELDARSLKGKSQALGEILQERNLYSRALGKISEVTPSGVSVTSLNFREGGKATLSGGAKSYEELAKFLKVVSTEEFFKSIQLTSASLEGETGEVRFSANLKIIEEKLKEGIMNKEL